MKLIIKSKFEWQEPASYYKWRRKIDREFAQKWRYFAKYAVIFSLPAFAILLLGCFLKSKIMYGIIFIPLFVCLMLCIIKLAVQFEKADIWILDDEIIYRFANSYKHFKYSGIENFSIKHMSEKNEEFDLLSIILKSGEKYSIGLNSKIDSSQLSSFLNTKIRVSN